MRNLHKIISRLLVLGVMQFFVPVLNVAMELLCCEEQAIPGGNIACCGAEFSSRMVCCYGNPAHAFDESAPAQCTPKSTSHSHSNLAAVSQGLVTSLRFALPIVTGDDFYSLNPHLASNQRYKLLATFLI